MVVDDGKVSLKISADQCAAAADENTVARNPVDLTQPVGRLPTDSADHDAASRRETTCMVPNPAATRTSTPSSSTVSQRWSLEVQL